MLKIKLTYDTKQELDEAIEKLEKEFNIVPMEKKEFESIKTSGYESIYKVKKHKRRIVLTKALKWKIQGIPIISFDSYFKAREYRSQL